MRLVRPWAAEEGFARQKLRGASGPRLEGDLSTGRDQDRGIGLNPLRVLSGGSDPKEGPGWQRLLDTRKSHTKERFIAAIEAMGFKKLSVLFSFVFIYPGGGRIRYDCELCFGSDEEPSSRTIESNACVCLDHTRNIGV